MELEITTHTHTMECKLYLNFWPSDDMADSIPCTLVSNDPDDIFAQVEFLNNTLTDMYDKRHAKTNHFKLHWLKDYVAQLDYPTRDEVIKNNLKDILMKATVTDVIDCWHKPMMHTVHQLCLSEGE